MNRTLAAMVMIVFLVSCSGIRPSVAPQASGGGEGVASSESVAAGSPETAKQGDETTSSSAELAEAASQNMWQEAEKEGFALTRFEEAYSPDKVYFACEREIPDPDLSVLHRQDLDGTGVVVIRRDRDNPDGPWLTDVCARRIFPRRVVLHFQWSPDSKFLVFTTASSGGHSPWHCQSYFYCVADKSFRDLEKALGDVVTSPDFTFEPPDTLVITVGRDWDEVAHRQIRASLSELVDKVEPLPAEPSE